MSENYIVINGKRAELTEEQMKQLGIEVCESKRWRANFWRAYYAVSEIGRIICADEENERKDDFRYYSHNYFRTEEEAKTYARVLETEMLLKKYADEHNGEFFGTKCQLCTDEGYLTVGTVARRNCVGHIIWFSSEMIALKAANEIGEDRIKEYLTYEW